MKPPKKAENPPVVFFSNRGTKLELYPLEGLARDIDADHPPALSPGGFCGITLAINVKSGAEVDALVKKALSCGATLVKYPQRVFWGGYSGYFRDPDGYYWEAAYGPASAFDEEEMLIIR